MPDDLDRLLDFHQDRSKMAKRVDESRKAPIADSSEQWLSAPDEYDWPGVDTPTASEDRAIQDFNEGNLGLKDLADRL